MTMLWLLDSPFGIQAHKRMEIINFVLYKYSFIIIIVVIVIAVAFVIIIIIIIPSFMANNNCHFSFTCI